MARPDPATGPNGTVAEIQEHVRLLDFGEADDEVRNLFETTVQPEGGWHWFATLAATTLDAGECAILAILWDANKRPIAAMPLVRRSDGRLRGLTSPYTCSFRPPLGRPADAAAFGRQLGPLVTSSLWIDALDAEDPAIQALLSGLRSTRLMTERFTHFVNWFDEVPNFDIYWAARDRQLQETVRRKRRQLERTGALSFSFARTPSELQAALSDYAGIYGRSWKGAEPHPMFVPCMVENMGAAGSVRMGVASINGRVAAAQIWLIGPGQATIFKLAHDEAFRQHSPGTLLTHALLRQISEVEGINAIDFGRGDDFYKRRWLTHRRERIGIVAANPFSLSGSAFGARHIVAPRLSRMVARLRRPSG